MKWATRFMINRVVVVLLCLMGLLLPHTQLAGAIAAGENALAYLAEVMDRYTDFYIYADKYAVANHFVPSGWMGDITDAFD